MKTSWEVKLSLFISRVDAAEWFTSRIYNFTHLSLYPLTTLHKYNFTYLQLFTLATLHTTLHTYTFTHLPLYIPLYTLTNLQLYTLNTLHTYHFTTGKAPPDPSKRRSLITENLI